MTNGIGVIVTISKAIGVGTTGVVRLPAHSSLTAGAVVAGAAPDFSSVARSTETAIMTIQVIGLTAIARSAK